jgi:hypothetical protein
LIFATAACFLSIKKDKKTKRPPLFALTFENWQVVAAQQQRLPAS